MTAPILATLQRTDTGDEGTFGTFDIPELACSRLSLELPDRGNKPMISRIPAGTYRATWEHSNRFKRKMYRLHGAPGRVGILIHPANFAGDKELGWSAELSGCIALGKTRGVLMNESKREQAALIQSKSAVSFFEGICNERDLLITITDEPKATP